MHLSLADLLFVESYVFLLDAFTSYLGWVWDLAEGNPVFAFLLYRFQSFKYALIIQFSIEPFVIGVLASTFYNINPVATSQHALGVVKASLLTVIFIHVWAIRNNYFALRKVMT